MPRSFCSLSTSVPYRVFIVRSGIGVSGTEGGGHIMIFLQLRNNISFLGMDDFRSVKSPFAFPLLINQLQNCNR